MKPERIAERNGYTLIEYLALIAIASILLGLIVPAIYAAREASKRRQCTAHLKTIGEAVHGFHQKQGGLPPICLFAGRPTIFAFLLPYLNEQHLQDKMVEDGLFRKADETQKTVIVLCDRSWYDKLKSEEKTAFSSVNSFKCPNRHGGVASTPDGDDDPSGGPQADYVTLIATWNGNKTDWVRFCEIKPYEPNPKNRETSPFRLPQLTFLPQEMLPAKETPGRHESHNKMIVDWKFTDRMDRWADGAGNQYIFAEKHIPRWALGGTDRTKSLWDGSWHAVHILTGDKGYVCNTARLIPREGTLDAIDPHLPSSEQMPYLCGELQQTIGSSHPGILCNILVGDGSVRPLWLNTSPELVWRMTHVNDALIEKQ